MMVFTMSCATNKTARQPNGFDNPDLGTFGPNGSVYLAFKQPNLSPDIYISQCPNSTTFDTSVEQIRKTCPAKFKVQEGYFRSYAKFYIENAMLLSGVSLNYKSDLDVVLGYGYNYQVYEAMLSELKQINKSISLYGTADVNMKQKKYLESILTTDNNKKHNFIRQEITLQLNSVDGLIHKIQSDSLNPLFNSKDGGITQLIQKVAESCTEKNSESEANGELVIKYQCKL